jgi:hypothetical protein
LGAAPVAGFVDAVFADAGGTDVVCLATGGEAEAVCVAGGAVAEAACGADSAGFAGFGGFGVEMLAAVGRMADTLFTCMALRLHFQNIKTQMVLSANLWKPLTTIYRRHHPAQRLHAANPITHCYKCNFLKDEAIRSEHQGTALHTIRTAEDLHTVKLPRQGFSPPSLGI